MALEIERKFLAAPSVLPLCRVGTPLVQGYLYTDAYNTIRVRRAGQQMLLAWKGPKNGSVREEVEIEVSRSVGEGLLASVPPDIRVEKIRYRVEHAGVVWDVDVFGGSNTGLILAEIELTHEDQEVALPPWIECEVTADARYRNSRLATRPASDKLAA